MKKFLAPLVLLALTACNTSGTTIAPVCPSSSPAPTVTVTQTASPLPAPTVTETETVPGPTVTVTNTVTVSSPGPTVTVTPAPIIWASSSPSPYPVISVSPGPTVTVTAVPIACVVPVPSASPSPSPSPSIVPSPSPSPSASYAVVAAKLVSPAAGSILSAFTQSFTLTAPNASMCYVYLGSTQGTASYDSFNVTSCNGPIIANNMPADGSTVWLRVFTAYPNGQTAGGADFSFKASAPVPLPSPSTTGSCSTIGTVTGLPYCTYAPNGTWSQPLPNNPTLNPNSAAMINGLYQNWSNPQRIPLYLNIPNTFPAYTTQTGDPTVTINTMASYGSSSGPAPVPLGVVPNSGTDGHLLVYRPSDGTEWDYYQFGCPNNSKGCSPTVITPGAKISVGAYSVTNYQTGTGWGQATTAAGAGLFAGLITADEWMSGMIHHPISMAAGCNNGVPYGSLPAVYPATSNAAWDCPTSIGNGIPYGSYYWFDMAPAQINALPIDHLSKMLLIALNQFGGVQTDTNGYFPLDMRNLIETPITPQGQAWLNMNGGMASQSGAVTPSLMTEPVSFWTTHLHIVASCVIQGTCPTPAPSGS